MSNRELQEQRMRGYFMQATKEILQGEGLKSISVRKIAERAGYSYATLYNYFKDINELVFLCVDDFQRECNAFVEQQTAGQAQGLERLQAKIWAYVSYFVEYPGIFELFFIENVGDLGHKSSTLKVITRSLQSACGSDWELCAQHGLLPAENLDNTEHLEALQNQMQHLVVGQLLFYLHRLTPATYTEFATQTQRQISAVIHQRVSASAS